MCGRFALDAPSKTLVDHFRLNREMTVEPRYNIAPSQPVLIVREGPHGNQLSAVRWGLIPRWAKDEKIGYKLINARAETVAEKPSFRDAFRSRRCLVPATGFYEWKHEGKTKKPYFISMTNRALFAMAGIWESWLSPDGKVVESCSIVTTEANNVVGGIHDRMPVIIPEQSYGLWLSPESDGGPFTEHLRPYPSDGMIAYPVGSMVNDVHNEGPACIRKTESD